MVSTFRLVLFICLFFSLKGLCYTPTSPSVSQTEGTTQKLQQLQSQIQSIEDHIQKNKHQATLLDKQLKQSDLQIGKTNEHIRNLETEIIDTKQRQDALAAQHQKLSSNKAIHEKMLSDLLQLTYKNLPKERWQFLLINKDLSSYMRQNRYYEELVHARKKEMQRLINQLSEVQITAQQLTETSLTLQTLQKMEVKKKNELANQNEERKNILSQIHSQISKNTKTLSQLKSEHQLLEGILKKLNSELASMPEYIEPALQFHKAKNTLQFPIEASSPTLMAVTHHSGQARKKSYVKAAVGTPVVAIYSGRVVFAEWLRGVGLLLIIDHGNGYMSLYGNNDILYKSVGEWVSKAEMIARVGQSGGHTEPGLYFELRKDGLALDPDEWFKLS